MISIISSLEIINIVPPDPNIFWWISATVADAAAAAVNPNEIKTLLASGWSTFFIKGNPAFSNGLKSLPKNPPDYHILYNWVFDNFILAEKVFAKALWSFQTCVLVNNSLCRKLFSSSESPTTFDKSYKLLQCHFNSRL